jgi:hypothetical protein
MKTLPYKKNFYLLMRVVAILSFLLGMLEIAPVHAEKMAAGSADTRNDILNRDGTLKLDGSYSGSIDLQDWNVKLDPLQGPVFAPAQALLPPGWSGLGSNQPGYQMVRDQVFAIAIDGDNVYVGGSFNDLGGGLIKAAAYIAKWDGTNWTALGSDGAGNGALNGKVYSIAVLGTEIYVGGAFTDVNNNGVVLPEADYIAKWDGTNWSALGSNGVGNGSLNSGVNTMAAVGSNLYVGGGFTNVNNNGTELPAADKIAKWDGANWSALGSNGAGDGSIQGGVAAIAVSGSDVYVGGSFTDLNHNGTILTAADLIAKWDGTNWTALGSNGAGDGSLKNALEPWYSSVAAIAVSNGIVYAGGGFLDVNNNGTVLGAADHIARWDGTNWSSLGSYAPNVGSIGDKVVNAIAVSGSNIYVGGYFSNVRQNGTFIYEADGIARWDGTNWHALGSNGAGDSVFGNNSVVVDAIAVSQKGVYVGGLFNNLTSNGVSIPNSANIAAYGKEPAFSDVPASHPYYSDIEILYANGLTAGCSTNPLKFCPDQIMNRGESAVFMLRANFGSSFAPGPSTHVFKDDWAKGTWAEPWANAMYTNGLSAGCSSSPLKYCPWDQIPREQAVIFALRMKYGTNYIPPAATGTLFADLTDVNYYATSWAEQAYKDSLIPNCGTSGGKPMFCPKALVSRGLGAYMIVRAKNLTMP